MSLVMRKPAFSICENKDADQRRDNREAGTSSVLDKNTSKVSKVLG